MATLKIFLAAILAVAAAQDLGTIINLHQSDQGDDWIELKWAFELGDTSYPLHKYTLTTNDDFSNDVRCPAATCTYVVDYLPSCTEHNFKLIPYFTDSGNPDLPGEMAETTGFTNDKIPGSPSNLQVVGEDDTGTSLQWDIPAENPDCVDHYEICSRVDGHTETICETTSGNTITLAALQACGLYHITITPITHSGQTAPELKETISTKDDVPGPPQNVVVGLITEETIQLLWNDPLLNPLCVDRYVITFGETHEKTEIWIASENKVLSPGSTYENEATISPLRPCTNYTIDIYSQNSAELASEKVTSYAGTAETEPLAPPTVVVGPNGPDSIIVIWGENEEDRCAGDFVICWNDGIHPIETCESVEGGGDNTFIITDLLPCTGYEVIVNVVSPGGGNYSDPTSNTTSTGDVVPSPVVDLMVTNVDVNQMSIRFDPPETHPQCVKEYDIRIIDQNEARLFQHMALKELTTRYIEDAISGLESCTDYLIMVSAVTGSGLRSPWSQVTNTTYGDTPSEPQELGLKAFDKSSITLQWFQPVDNARCVTEYELSWTGSVTGTATVSEESTFKITYAVTGLNPCEAYTFTLFAVSPDGNSDPVEFTQETAC